MVRPNYPSRPGDRGTGARPGPPGTDLPPPGSLDPATARKILDGDSELLVKKAEELGTLLANQRLKTSQIRNVFGTVRRIEMSWPRSGAHEDDQREAIHEMLMLKPKLAYQAARARGQDGGDGVTTLDRALRPLIEGVGTDRARFQRFVDFFEATLAYHRASGGS
jgi:CRISPR-associated protein Csm2